jgi:phospholipase/lecithinase/hemolysin
MTPDVAVAGMQTDANSLVALIKDQIVAKGARRVVVMTALDVTVTPEYRVAPDSTKALLKQLSDTFNTTLTTGLDGVNVRIFDSNAMLSQVMGNPGSYGFVNTTTAACDPVKIEAITGGLDKSGTSLFCNASAGVPFNGMKAGASATTWMFADGVHPTSGTHKVLGDIMITNLKNFGWIPPNL